MSKDTNSGQKKQVQQTYSNAFKKRIKKDQIHNLQEIINSTEKRVDQLKDPSIYDSTASSKLKEISQSILFFMEFLEPYYDQKKKSKNSTISLNLKNKIRTEINDAITTLGPTLNQYNNRNINLSSNLIKNIEDLVFQNVVNIPKASSYKIIEQELSLISKDISDSVVNQDINFDFFFAICLKRILELIFIYVNSYDNNNLNTELLTNQEKYVTSNNARTSFLLANKSDDSDNSKLTNNIAKYVITSLQKKNII